MPVSLSPQQQAQVDQANSGLASANTALQNAISAYQSEYNRFCGGYWATLTDCDIRDAESNVPKWVKFTAVLPPPFVAPAILAGLGLVKKWQRTRYTKATSCQNALEKGPLVSWKCFRGTGDCRDKDTCDGRINEYNANINRVYSANATVASAQQAYDQAKANLDNVLDAISKDPTIAGQTAENIAAIEGEKSKERTKWLLFGLIALTVVVGAVLMVRRAA